MSKVQKNFLSGALILTVANVLVKIIGAVYKIPLANLITPKGMDYYNDAYQIYALLFVISTAGVPVAIAKLVSESVVAGRLREPKRILKVSLAMFAAISFTLAALVMIFAPQLSRLLSNDRTNLCIYMIAPSIFLVIIASAIKGYFQGYKCMTPSAAYQVIEAVFKLFGLVVIFIMIKRGVTDVMILACGGVLGVTFGSFASAVFMMIRYLCEHEIGKNVDGSLPSRGKRQIAKSVITLAIPISLSSAVMSVTSTLDMFLVKWNLGGFFGAAGKAGAELTDLVKSTYGAYVGATSSLFNLPQAVTVTVGVAVLPFLTTAFAKHDREDAFRNMRSSSKLVGMLAMPCTLGLCFLAEPIVKILYAPSYWPVGISTLHVLALSVYFVSFSSLTGVFLQSVGKVNTALMSMGAGAVVKLTVNIVMVRLIGIMGAPIGTFLCYLTIVMLNMLFIKKFIGFGFPVSDTFLKPLVCSFIACGGAWLVWFGLSRIMGGGRMSLVIILCAAIAVAAVLYAATVLVFRLLSKEDMALLPGGEKIGKILERRGFIK